MILWPAGVPGGPERTRIFQDGVRRLVSYLEVSDGRLSRLWEERKRSAMSKVELFLDSGAFSAFTKGVEIDLDAYCAFIREHLDILTVYANLDVIGDPEATLRNQKAMEAKGLKPLPCFHYGEPLRYLHHYLKHHPYIALGGMAANSQGTALRNEVRQSWLDSIFGEHICGADGLPKVKVHGFGLTSLPLMLRYPWYSVDSTSWVMTGRMGFVLVPKPWRGHLGDPWKVCVSSQSPTKSEEGEHIDSLSPTHQTMVLEYFHSKGYSLGKSSFRRAWASDELAEGERWAGKPNLKTKTRMVERVLEPGISNDYRQRDELNVIYFLDLEKALPAWPWAFRLPRATPRFAI